MLICVITTSIWQALRVWFLGLLVAIKSSGYFLEVVLPSGVVPVKVLYIHSNLSYANHRVTMGHDDLQGAHKHVFGLQREAPEGCRLDIFRQQEVTK